jgi:hypothetical protein
MKKKPQGKTDLEREEEYVDFLRKRLNSDNFKENESKEVIEKTKKKFNKAKLKVKMMKEGNWK